MPSNSTSNSTKTHTSNNNKKRNILIAAGVALAAAALGLASYSATKPADTTVRPTEAKETAKGPAAEVETDAQSGVYPELEKLARREAGDKLAMGRPDAPVVMVEYADFKCGFCGKFARDTEPELVKKYVDNGTLRIEWRNFPIFGEESAAVARASWAAGQQGRFWQFHSAAYAKGAKEKGFAADRLAELAKEAGVPDLAKFTADANGEAAKASVQKDQTEGYSLNINATPAFLINGRPIAGAMPDDVFVDAIEKAAKTAKSNTSQPAGDAGATKSQGGDK